MKYTKYFMGPAIAVFVIGGFFVSSSTFLSRIEVNRNASSFFECLRQSGSVVFESTPRKCWSPEGQIFVEPISQTMKKADHISLSNIKPEDMVSSPLIIKGKATEDWFFKKKFPVVLLDSQYQNVAKGYADAKRVPRGQQKVGNLIPFEVTLHFEISSTTPAIFGEKGRILFLKGSERISAKFDSVWMPVQFASSTVNATSSKILQ